MPPVDANSLAAANAVGVQNKVFEPVANVLKRKIIIFGSYDPTKTGVNDNVPVRVLSAEQVGSLFGFGFQLHRLARQVFKTSNNTETWVMPQPEAGGGQKASDGKIAWTGPATEDGKASIYLAGEKYAEFDITNGDTANDIAAAAEAALDAADSSIPVVAGSNLADTTFDAKSQGTYGNEISIDLNLGEGEALPAGVGAVVTPFSDGAGNPDIQDSLDALGVGDNQNEMNFTALVHCYGQITAALDAISEYNGEGNDFEGNYSKTVARPFRALAGDVDPDLAALTALIAVTDARKEDRTNGIVAVPGSENAPSDIAALAMGLMEAKAGVRAEENYINEELPDIRTGDVSERWTSEYDNRDTAVKSGVSPTLVKNGVVTLQNVVTFYRPDSIPQANNGYRSMRNISILQNLLADHKATFDAEKWQGITIVADVAKVLNATSRLKARDRDSVIDELVSQAIKHESIAWIYAASFTVDRLKDPASVVLRPAGNGFDIIYPVVLSGEGGILDTTIEFDTSLAVFL